MNSMKLVIPLHFISWKKTPNDAVTPQCLSQFTPKMKASAVTRLLSSLVWIDQYNECNAMTSFMEFSRSGNPRKNSATEKSFLFFLPNIWMAMNAVQCTTLDTFVVLQKLHQLLRGFLFSGRTWKISHCICHLHGNWSVTMTMAKIWGQAGKLSEACCASCKVSRKGAI